MDLGEFGPQISSAIKSLPNFCSISLKQIAMSTNSVTHFYTTISSSQKILSVKISGISIPPAASPILTSIFSAGQLTVMETSGLAEIRADVGKLESKNCGIYGLKSKGLKTLILKNVDVC